MMTLKGLIPQTLTRNFKALKIHSPSELTRSNRLGLNTLKDLYHMKKFRLQTQRSPVFGPQIWKASSNPFSRLFQLDSTWLNSFKSLEWTTGSSRFFSSTTQPERKKIFLKDHRAPPFIVEQISLTFELDEETLVHSEMKLKRSKSQSTSELRLNGDKDSKVIRVQLNDRVLSAEEYQIERTEDQTYLVISDSVFASEKEPFTLRISNAIYPSKNKTYSGLYNSDDIFCTQCEAEGFRKITYFFDRPDVLTVYSVKLIADKSKYPVLLSNGNLIESGALEGGKHFALWQDPFKKPSYLFALVAGNLGCIKDQFITKSGRTVDLRIYSEEKNISKCDHAMKSLKKAMKWDEDVFGLECDLSNYNIVAVNIFNMGAMENKGLNIFNSKYIVVDEKTATDRDFENVERVVAHEYFHNWTGNRVTCRDWFQLSLKEGLTVFREQLYCADMGSPVVKRIDDVIFLTTKQFEEDSGPTAHPVRPEYFYEISNFYTPTVYEKGAEVIRMMYMMLGKERFRKGIDLYFHRHDGSAVTVEDFVAAMQDSSGLDLTQFRNWYSQAGTPLLNVSSSFDQVRGLFRLHIYQTCPEHSELYEPLHIPVLVGILDRETGKDLLPSKSTLLHLKEQNQTFSFPIHTKELPIPSILRKFSAPVRVKYAYTDEELQFLAMHDSDEFNRWVALQRIYLKTILEKLDETEVYSTPNLLDASHPIIKSFQKLLSGTITDKRFLSVALMLPQESEIGQHSQPWDPVAVHNARKFVQQSIASAFYPTFLDLYSKQKENNAETRKLKNVCLSYLLSTWPDLHQEAIDLAVTQFNEAKNMTDQFGALACLTETTSKERGEILASFFDQWKDNPLVMTKWFAVQAMSEHITVDKLKELMKLPQFSLQTPNLVFALIGSFAMNNPGRFHDVSGNGYVFLADVILTLDQSNPQISARMAKAFAVVNRLDCTRQEIIRDQVKRILNTQKVSPDLFEILNSILSSAV